MRKPTMTLCAGLGLMVLILLISLVALHFARANPVLAAPGSAAYEITWWTMDSGGSNALAANGYTLSGTVGQPDAASLTDGSYQLLSGFWPGTIPWHSIFLPLVVR